MKFTIEEVDGDLFAICEPTPPEVFAKAIRNGYAGPNITNVMTISNEGYAATTREKAVLLASAPDLAAALESIASQKLTTEMESPEDADFIGAYDEMVTIARNALKKANP